MSEVRVVRENAGKANAVAKQTESAVKPFDAFFEFLPPVIDIQRSDGNLEVTAELPGLKKEEVKVEMMADALVIHGERRNEAREDHDGFHRFESSYGKFYRAIPLPEGVKRDAVKAELGGGVLRIHVPVTEVTKNTRAVPVEHVAAGK